MPEVSQQAWANMAQAAAQPGPYYHPSGFRERVSHLWNRARNIEVVNREQKTIFGRPWHEFAADVVAGYIAKGAIKGVVVGGVAGTVGGFGAAILAGAAAGGIYAGGKEYASQVRENWKTPLPPEAVKIQDKLLERFKQLKPTDLAKIGSDARRGAVTGMVGGFVGGLLSEAVHGLSDTGASVDHGAASPTATVDHSTATSTPTVDHDVTATVPGGEATVEPTVTDASPTVEPTDIPTAHPTDTVVAGVPTETVVSSPTDTVVPPTSTPVPGTPTVEHPPMTPTAYTDASSPTSTPIDTPVGAPHVGGSGGMDMTDSHEHLQPHSPAQPAPATAPPPAAAQPGAHGEPWDRSPGATPLAESPHVAPPGGGVAALPIEHPGDIPGLEHATSEYINNLGDYQMVQGDNPWDISEKLLHDIDPNRVYSSDEIKAVTKIICEKNNIGGVWGMTGTIDHQHIPIGFVLKLGDPDVKSAIVAVAKGG